MNKNVLIAMSGGVDSSVAAHLIKDAGYECAGATMRLYDSSGDMSDDEILAADCAPADAHKVCQKLGIDFHLLNCKNEFENIVIQSFIKSYENGETPNPCVVCNKKIKFGIFLDKAIELGMDYVATGHYAICEKSGDRFYLKKGADIAKDQSYFLYGLTQHQLSHTLFPIGNLNKNQIREIAFQNGFETASKKDSQDICFVPDGDYVSVIKAFTGKEYPRGNFVNTRGEVIGSHLGFINYTIGQRKGLGCGFGEKVYVCDKNAEKNEVVLGKNDDLFTNTLKAVDFNWIACDAVQSSIKGAVKIRYSAKESPAVIHPTDDNSVIIEFETPQRAVAKGQAVVVYDGDYVVGGGTIA